MKNFAANKPVAYLLIMALVVLNVQVPVAQAGLVGTEELLTYEQAQMQRDRVHALLDRQDVQGQLAQLGVATEEAKARVDALTDMEIARLAGALDQLPAGGTNIIGALLLIFVVLLITDILGFTKVFPFTRPIG
jgi:hypothetical protein